VKANDNECILEEPTIPNSIIHITHACFGEQVTKGSRTVVYCSSNLEEEGTPICVLIEGSNESKQLDLLFGSPAKFSLKGRSPSTVYLTGYVQPESSPMPPDDMDDLNDLSDSEIQMHEKVLREKLQSRKRAAHEHEHEHEDEDVEANIHEPATKKRKTETGTQPKKQEKQEKKEKQAKQTKPETTKVATDNNTKVDATVATTTTATTANNNNEAASATQDKPLSKRQQKKLQTDKKKRRKTRTNINNYYYNDNNSYYK